MNKEYNESEDNISVDEMAEDYCYIEGYDDYHFRDDDTIVFYYPGSGGLSSSKSMSLSIDKLKEWYEYMNK